MNKRLISVTSFIAAMVLVLGFVSPTKAAIEMVPNLTPLEARHLNVQQIGRKKYLRFSTTSWNNGAGALEIRGGASDRQTNRQKVYQRIYADDGSFRDVLAGSFTWHKAHKHIHFDDFAVYTLQPVSAPGASDRQSSKTTFCIMDTDHISPVMTSSPATAQYNTCGMDIQGMSVGWGDTYGYQLSGQSIDISKLPDGEYNLKIEIDPRGRIIESNDADNVSNLRFQLAGNTVTVL